MQKYQHMIRDYLEQIGRLDETIVLGPKANNGENEDKPIDPEVLKSETRNLSEALDKRFKFNNGIIILALGLLTLLFFVGVILVFYYRATPSVMGTVFGGTFLSLLSIVGWLYKLWKHKSVMDITLSIIEGLPPEKAAEFILLIYWKTRGEENTNK